MGKRALSRPFSPQIGAPRRGELSHTIGSLAAKGRADIETLDAASYLAPEDTLGLVLAGGAGRRLGGADKGLMRLPSGARGASVAKSVLDPLCDHVFISANRNLDAYTELAGGHVVHDLRSGFCGPLAGLEAIRGVLGGRRLLLLPCDMPDVHPRVFTVLMAAIDSDSTLDYAYAEANDSPHYLVAALRASALCSVTSQLDRREYAVRHWLQGLRATHISFKGAEATSLRNRNLAKDWGEDNS